MSATEIWSWVLIGLQIIIGLAATVAISLRRKPSTAIAWIMAIVLIPYVGFMAFLLIGFGRLPRKRRDKQKAVNDFMHNTSGLEVYKSKVDEPEWLKPVVAMNDKLGALPMVHSNSAYLIQGYEESLETMVEEIDKAENFVHIEFYIFVKDQTTAPFFDALARAVQRGVAVRVLFDHVATLRLPNRRETMDALDDMGADWHHMLPLKPWKGQWQRPDLRNHRKLLVVDGKIGFMGSQNLIDSTYLKPGNIKRGLHWKELMVRLEGSIVAELDAVFLTDWYSETDEIPHDDAYQALTPIAERLPAEQYDPRTVFGLDAQVIPSGPSFENDNNLKLFVALIHNARHRVSITSPYFVPDEATLQAIITAASRGLEVELFVSEVADQAMVYHAQRSYYEALLDAGVMIYQYPEPTVLHSKHFSIDDEIAVIGSSNMDIRSFSLNMEVSMLVRGREFVDQMRQVEDAYRSISKPIDPEQWKSRPLKGKILDALARLTSGLQ
ncbi:cardiolipin synthase [Glutamicibacter uratoxydans]|uniref:Cardiolipin synthase n=1 Tax=Glutamicibacter uratoxydans TaxID=43667 RepID=A0A4Y4DZP9_GLUUR|nr:cardiolipin synthase [Glutamicibacter uratoxydans]GED07821.1 cardiolipin synthase [Glutamicibacter uratoxydans]